MTEETTNAYSAFIPEIWSKKLNNMIENECVMLNCVNRNWEGEIKNQGDKVKIITPAEVSISTLSSDAITYSELEPTSQELVIDQKKFFAFKINDVASVQANNDIMEAHLRNAQRAIEKVQDAYLLSQHIYADEANVIGSDTEPVTLSRNTIYAKCVDLATRLKKSGANFENNAHPWIIINPDIEYYLLQCSEFLNSSKVADESIREGAVGRIAGMDVYVSPNLVSVNGLCYVLAGTNEAITFASQLTKIESLRDKDSFSDLVRGLYLYGAKTVQPKCLAKLVLNVGS